MVVQIVTEQLDVADRRFGDRGVGEVPREEDEGDVADILRVDQPSDVSDLKRGIASSVEYLWSALDGG